jgi:hypothetical protein
VRLRGDGAPVPSPAHVSGSPLDEWQHIASGLYRGEQAATPVSSVSGTYPFLTWRCAQHPCWTQRGAGSPAGAWLLLGTSSLRCSGGRRQRLRQLHVGVAVGQLRGVRAGAAARQAERVAVPCGRRQGHGLRAGWRQTAGQCPHAPGHSGRPTRRLGHAPVRVVRHITINRSHKCCE